MALVGEAHGDAVALDRPQLLDQAVVQLALPLAGQEGHDLVPAVDELRPVAPLGVDGVGARDLLGIAGIPRVLGHAHLLDGGLVREGREWGTGHDALLSVSAAFGSWERRASRASRAARKQASGASATPAPIWPLPSELCRIPVVTFGVMPCSTTRRTSTPSGVPRPSVIGRVIRLDRPRHTRSSSRGSAAAAAAPPTNWLTAGDPSAAAPPRPTSSSTALSPMSGAPSSGPRPGWYSARPIIGAGERNHADPGSRTPNVVPLRAIVVTTDEPATCPAHSVSVRAAAIASVRNSRW